MYRNLNEKEMKEKTGKLRVKILEMLCEAGSGHTGGSLSCVDILAVLYNKVMNIDPKNPGWEKRDRFVLSKGHCCPALYAVLADLGYFDEKELMTLRKYGSMLQGHPYMYDTPGIEVSTGSLGQGLSVAAGMALAAKMDGLDIRTYCLMGDGELQEGQIWEAAMAAGHYGLDKLCGIVDKNNLQIDGRVEDVMNIDPLADKFRAFNWNVTETDGHDPARIEDSFNRAAQCKNKPTVIIAHTVKGKGVSFMENKSGWHGQAPDCSQLKQALAELDGLSRGE
ncbi:MAG: transketolase [Treponema sp.]|jgi:transketolase|nr:transketolase [Treponema sp.]